MADGQRPKVPGTALKRTAADTFSPYDPDASQSETDSESETERRERYPLRRKPSPQKTAGRMRAQLSLARTKRNSAKNAMKAEMDNNDTGRETRSRRRLRNERPPSKKQLDPMPRDFATPGDVEDEDCKPGSGQVFLDGEESKRAWNDKMRKRRSMQTQKQQTATSSNLPKSDMGFFAALPGELRNRIYRFALVEGGDDPFMLRMKKNTCNVGACLHMRAGTAVPGILSTCKQVRAEAMTIFMAENTFKFDADLVKARCVANWIRVVGPYADLLSKFILEVVCWEQPVGVGAAGAAKVEARYSISLSWVSVGTQHLLDMDGKNFDNIAAPGQWRMDSDREIPTKAMSEYSLLQHYIDDLNRDMEDQGKPKAVALREFVWCDWMARLVYVCRK